MKKTVILQPQFETETSHAVKAGRWVQPDRAAKEIIVVRTSFRNFLGLASGDKVSDARTVWVFKNQLTEKRLAANPGGARVRFLRTGFARDVQPRGRFCAKCRQKRPDESGLQYVEI